MKWSNFHITVNYNIDGEEHIDQMRQAIENMAESPYLWQWLKHYNGGKHDFSPENKLDVESVRIRAAFEHGGQQNHGLHAHILIEVGHRTMVQVEKQGVIDVFREVLPDNNPNIHIRFVRGDGEDKDFILHYITKEVPRYRPDREANQRLKRAFGPRGVEIGEANNENPA